jgi:hypothetical protein
MRTIVAKGIKERRGSGAHQRGSNWLEGLADVVEFSEQSRRLETVFAREKKRGKGEVLGPFIGEVNLEKGLGFGEIDRVAGRGRAGEGRRPEEEEGACQVRPSRQREEVVAAYPFGKSPGGPWADLKTGPNRSPRPFIPFLFSFPFLFPVFSFLFHLLQKLSKSIQTFFLYSSVI